MGVLRAGIEALSSDALKAVRDAPWLTGDRATAAVRVLFAAMVAMFAAWAWVSYRPGATGHLPGADFTSFWTASQLALSGRPELAYDVAAHWGAQNRLYGREVLWSAFFYPPVFLLFCLPLALVPYLVSVSLWLAATGAAYLAVLRAWAGRELGWLPLLAFPAVLFNVIHGQNGFLTAALLGGGLLLLDRRPILAGVLLGCLALKPHLALVLPIALAAGGRWRTFFSTGVTASGLGVVSFAVFGLETWRAFIDASPMARSVLEQGLVTPDKMQSVFAAVRLLQGSVSLAWVVQGAVAAAACVALVRLQTTRPRGDGEGAAIAAAALLASPFLLDYDLVVLALPLAWLAREGLRSGFLPWEKTLLLAAFLLPGLSRWIAGATGVPLAPFVIGGILLLVLRRAGVTFPSFALRGRGAASLAA